MVLAQRLPRFFGSAVEGVVVRRFDCQHIRIDEPVQCFLRCKIVHKIKGRCKIRDLCVGQGRSGALAQLQQDHLIGQAEICHNALPFDVCFDGICYSPGNARIKRLRHDKFLAQLVIGDEGGDRDRRGELHILCDPGCAAF